MKRLFIAIAFLSLNTVLFAQTATTKPKPKPAVPAKPAVAKPVAQKPVVLKTLLDSACYAMGLSAATFYKEQGIKTINTEILSRAIKDVLKGEQPLMDDATINNVMNKLMTQIQEESIRPAIDSGNAFLKRNKLKPGVKTTASGLQYEVITEGTGIKPTANDSVTCHYRGTLLNGTEFDASYNRGEPITFHLSGVIRGWTEGVQLMSEGSKYKFYVPYTLGYGSFDNGPIPGGSLLIFEVELLKVIKNP